MNKDYGPPTYFFKLLYFGLNDTNINISRCIKPRGMDICIDKIQEGKKSGFLCRHKKKD